MSDLCPVAASVITMSLDDQPKTMGGSLLHLLKTKKFCDVIFTFPNLPARVEAHEFCLKARSPVFEQIFRMRKSGNVEGNEIEISECTPERFQQFLEFIYLDTFEVDIAGGLDLLQLSLKYKVQPLTEKCEQLILTEIPILDSVKVFAAASRHGHRELMDRAGPIIAKSFLELARTDALVNVDEETLLYLLEREDLAVQDVGLFQFLQEWGRNQAGASACDRLLRNKLKNLISKIRYTNMAPDEFSKVVVPTGLLSAEECVSVYKYLCVDEVTRRSLKTEFNTTSREVQNTERVTKVVDFYADQIPSLGWFPRFTKHCVSFKIEKSQVDGKLRPDYTLKRTLITAIHFRWPDVKPEYREHHVLNLNVSLMEYCGPVKEENFTRRFQKKLLNCKRDSRDEVSVEPPVELISGRTYSVVVEDQSTSDFSSRLYSGSEAYHGPCSSDISRESKIDLKGVCVTLKEIHRNIDYKIKQPMMRSQDLFMIRGIVIGLV